MSDNGSAFFNAPKPSRNSAFHFVNQDGQDQAELNGDQSVRLHPVPAVLGTAQKVGNPLLEPAPVSTDAEYSGRQPAGPSTAPNTSTQGR